MTSKYVYLYAIQVSIALEEPNTLYTYFGRSPSLEEVVKRIRSKGGYPKFTTERDHVSWHKVEALNELADE